MADHLKLDTLQRDLLIPQIEAFIEATSDDAARDSYLALKSAVESMEVAPEHQARLRAARSDTIWIKSAIDAGLPTR